MLKKKGGGFWLICVAYNADTYTQYKGAFFAVTKVKILLAFTYVLGFLILSKIYSEEPQNNGLLKYHLDV